MAPLLQGIDLAAIRRDMPATDAVAYLNTGTTGPLPRPTVDVMAQAAEQEASAGRLGRQAAEGYRQDAADLRALLAGFVGADPEEIGLTHNTTEGVNIAIWGLNWREGDTVVTTTLEHGGGLLPLYQAHHRYGVQIKFADIGQGGRGQTLDAMSRAIQPGVRLVVLSHVAWSSGAVLPLKEIADMAHAVGALVAVDGAQSVGAIPVDMHDLGVDAYAFPGQKWLCGPEGTGGLFIRNDKLDTFQPTFTGFRSVNHDVYRPNDPATLAFEPSARRYEVASVYRPGIKGLRASVQWATAQGATFEAIKQLADYCLAAVSDLSGVEILTPPSADLSGLVAFKFTDVDVSACVAYLAEQSVAIRSIPDNGSLRISCGFFNTTEEIDRTVRLIGEFRRR